MELLTSPGLLKTAFVLADAVYGALTDRGLIEHAIELIEFGFQGGAWLIEQEQDEVLERQLASAGKVLWLLAVGIDEGGTIKRTGYFLYNFQAGVWRAMSTGVE